MAITYLRRTAWRLVQARHTLMERRPKPVLPVWLVFTLNTFVCIGYLVGSCFFFTWLDNWALYAGAWCYMSGSFITCFVSICHAVDRFREMRYLQAEVDLMSDEAVRNRTQQEYEEKHDDLMKSICFVASSIIFASGSVLFYPDLFHNKVHQEWGEEVGAGLFIVGSFGFVIAAYWNSMAMVKNAGKQAAPAVGSIEYRRRRIMSFELGLSMLGSVMFVTGSFLYRPSYATDCSHEALRAAKMPHRPQPGTTQMPLPRRRPHHALLSPVAPYIALSREPQALRGDFQGLCVNVMNQGTWLYLFGSALFVVQCGLVAWRLSLPADDAESNHGDDCDSSPDTLKSRKSRLKSEP